MQAPKSKTSAVRTIWRATFFFAKVGSHEYTRLRDMIWLLLEAALALALLILIVWFILPGKSAQARDPKDK